MKWLARPLLFGVMLLLASPASAGYLNVIKADRLPAGTVSMLSELPELEPYVAEWQPTWPHGRSKEDVRARVAELYKKCTGVLTNNPENGELLLLCGLIAFYGHNVDLDESSKRADAHFAAAQKALPDDYRPQWFLGMHLVKSTRCAAEGMKLLLEAETKQTISEPMFWEDYATAAYFTSMYSHALQALEKVRKLSGRRSRLEDIFGDKIRAAARTPKPGEKMRTQDLWRSIPSDTSVTLVSFPFGYKFSVKKKYQDFQTIDFDGRFGALQVGLTPRTGAGGVKRVPTLQVMTFIAKEKEALEEFAKRFLTKSAKWQHYDLGLNLGVNEVSYLGESPDHYKADGGAKVIMVAFERNSPKVPRFVLEEPEEELKGANPGFYRLTHYYERFRGRLFYQIWLETPTRFFDESLAEFKEILGTFRVE